ncbi:RAM signaling network component [Tulasnella sp. 425]|nr:RAM signaling network component [Tulasnella sp. 425]
MFASPGGAEKGPLSHKHISEALRVSTDGGQTLDFSHKFITDVKDDATHELAKIGREDDDDEGCVTRRVAIALVFNDLTSLPTSFTLISRLRYLNLRSNFFAIFPEVLCNMPSLEILDISRNKLRRMPPRPGTLKNLRVFSFTRNKVERIPTYFAEFNRLRMLKIEHNPIEWPPGRVLRRTEDGDEAMEHWIRDLQAWLRANPEDEHLTQGIRPEMSASVHRGPQADIILPSDDEPPRNNGVTVGMLSNSHSRAPSEESMNSNRNINRTVRLPDFSLDPSPQLTSGTPAFSNMPSSSFGGPSSLAPNHGEDFMNSHRDDSVLQGGSIHGRNASASFMGGRSTSAGNGLLVKKSLPDLRSAHLNGVINRNGQPRKGEKGRGLDEPAVPPLSSNQIARDVNGQPRPTTRGTIGPSSSTIGPAMDAERHSYFKRYSTLPSSSVSKTIPEAMLKTVDAIRGIFFAVGQMHSAIQHYTVFGTDERQASGVLGRLMNGANEFMSKLMTALDRFDSLSRRVLPPPGVCRELIEACRDTVTLAVKVVGVLGAQLKVLAGTDDLRFARTSLLMLYGAMAEVSNSWHALAPNLDAIQPLLQEYRAPPVSRSHAASSSTPGRSKITPIAESPASPPRTLRSPNVPYAVSGKRVGRRNGGSFSYKDLEIGKSLVASSPASTGETGASSISSSTSSSGSTVVNGTSGTLKSVRRNNPGSQTTNTPSTSPSLSSALPGQPPIPPVPTHSRDNSASSGSTPVRGTPVPSTTPRPVPPTLARSRTSDLPDSAQLVDRDMLATMDQTCDIALKACTLVEQEFFPDGNDDYSELKEGVDKAREVTMTLKQDIEGVRAGYLESERKALYDHAQSFAKAITNLAVLLKKDIARCSPSLKQHIAKLINSTKDYTMLLSVSSFAPAVRPFSPAFAPSSSLPASDRNHLGPSALGRSRSATATQELTPKAGTPQHTAAPWSAMPHQTFRVPQIPPPTSSLGSQRFDEEEERPYRRV